MRDPDRLTSGGEVLDSACLREGGIGALERRMAFIEEVPRRTRKLDGPRGARAT
jgi:hypothetical protein